MKKSKILFVALFILIFFFTSTPRTNAQSSNYSNTSLTNDLTNFANSQPIQSGYTAPAPYMGPVMDVPADTPNTNWQTQGQYDITSGAPTATVVPDVSSADMATYDSEIKKAYQVQPSSTTGAQSPTSAAASGCIGGFIGQVLGGFLTKTLNSLLPSSLGEVFSVKTGDVNQKGANFRDETMNGIAFCIGNALIDAMTASTVQWINNGFKNPDGTKGPGFLTNPGKFFKQMADREVGAFFQGLGPIGNIVCKPFDLKIRLALLNNNNNSSSQQCTLTSIKQNLSRFGQNGNGGYLGDWFQLTQENNNNTIGSYFTAKDKLSEGISYNMQQNKMEIDLGKGFFNLKKCKKYSSTAVDPNTGKAQCSEWESTTPGAEVQASLDRAMGSKTHRLEIATNFNQIVSALVNQIVIQAMKGLTGGNDYAGSSAESTMTNRLNNVNAYTNSAIQTGAVPTTDVSTSTETATTTINTASTTVTTAVTHTLTIATSHPEWFSGLKNPYTNQSLAEIKITSSFSGLFSGWEGCTSSYGDTCYVWMDGDKTIKANFRFNIDS